MENLQFGEIVETEFEQLISLYRQLQPNDPIISDGSDRVIFQHILGSEYFFLLGVRSNHQLVGSAYANIVPNLTRSASPYAVIENVITTTELQNQGIGKQLMSYTLDFIWHKGCYKAMLLTGSKQQSTHGFYQACGFSGTAKFGYIAYPHNT